MLTNKYPAASIRQLLHVAFPLMIAALSVHSMLLVDRVVVARYSTDALSAITLAGNVCALVEVGAIIVASIAEVFVGQYNGGQKYNKIAAPVWQMIWFGAALFIFTIPFGLYTAPIFIPGHFLDFGNDYYVWCMVFAPLHAFIAALSSFYIGRGKTRFTMAVVILGNVINIALDLVLVLGYKDIVPALGPVGAAYGTVISLFVQTIILFISFLTFKNRKKFGTHIYKFNKELFAKCIKLGVPNAVGVVLEILGWFSVVLLTAYLKPEYMSLHSMVQSVMIFVIFFIDALSRGTTVIASNMIGSKKVNFITKLLHSGFKIHGIYLAVLFVPLFVYPEFIIGLFFKDTSSYSVEFIEQVILSLRFVWLFILVDGISWVGCGVLLAGGDILFLTILNSITIWVFSVLPIAILIKFYDVDPSTLWLLMSAYKVVSITAFILRYRSKRWLKLVL